MVKNFFSISMLAVVISTSIINSSEDVEAPEISSITQIFENEGSLESNNKIISLENVSAQVKVRKPNMVGDEVSIAENQKAENEEVNPVLESAASLAELQVAEESLVSA